MKSDRITANTRKDISRMEYTLCKVLGALVFMFVFTPIGSKIIDSIFTNKQEKKYRKADKKIMRKIKKAERKKKRLRRKNKKNQQLNDINMTKEEYIQACWDELKL